MNRQPLAFKHLLVAVLLMAASPQLVGQELDVNLSNDSALFRYISHHAGGGAFGGRTETDLGFLYTTDDDVLGMAGIQVVGEAGSGSPGLDAGLGLKAFAATAGNDDIFALTLGGQIQYRPPLLNNRLSLGLEGFYSPDIVTYWDAESFGFFAGRVAYEILPQASAYLGYRKVRTDLETGGKFTIESGGHVGVSLAF